MSNVIPGNCEAAHNAAVWLRKQFNIEAKKPIFNLFEEHFNCKLNLVDRRDPWECPKTIKFKTGEEATMFLLKWQ